MPSPFRKDQLSPEMARRYGLDRTPWIAMLVSIVVIVAFAGVLGWIGLSMTTGVKTRVLTWDDSAPDHVTIDVEVQRDGAAPLECVIRAQDRTHIDTGYAIDLIDVRTPAEFREVHAVGAKNIPLDEINAEQMIIGRKDDGEQLYMICRSDSRGKKACEAFHAA